ncbi:MAG: PA2779 family protein [Alphaproteobacteria bacterium]|nr:PA2779 family protein [Alphaproteobacteria bacterium]
MLIRPSVFKPISRFVILAVAMLSLYPAPAPAAMVETDSVLRSEPSPDAAGPVSAERERLKRLLRRQAARDALRSHGLSAEEATARIDALSDAEVRRIAGRLDRLPAGAFHGAADGARSAALIIVVVGILLILVLLFAKLVPDDS